MKIFFEIFTFFLTFFYDMLGKNKKMAIFFRKFFSKIPSMSCGKCKQKCRHFFQKCHSWAKVVKKKMKKMHFLELFFSKIQHAFGQNLHELMGHPLFSPYTNFFCNRTFAMELTGFWHMTLNLILVGCGPQYVHPQGTQVAGNFGHSQNWPQFRPKIFNICWPSVPDGCTYWPALRGMKGTYLGYQSMIVSILDHLFGYGFLGLICRTLENSVFWPILH